MKKPLALHMTSL